jgi:hypothetical protein
MALNIPLPITGACQCRAVGYEIRAAPLVVYACHCTECQRQSGSAFSLSLIAARESVIVTRGGAARWRRQHESGRVIQCVLCGDCGARLFHEPEANPKVTVVKPGTLDDTRWLHPVGHIWTRSAQPWFPLPPDAVNYDMQPPNLERLIAAWQSHVSGA